MFNAIKTQLIQVMTHGRSYELCSDIFTFCGSKLEFSSELIHDLQSNLKDDADIIRATTDN